MDQKGNKFKNLLKRWFIDAFSGMAMGLFATLLIGLIIKQIGTLIGSDTIVGSTLIVCGQIASSLMGAGIGAGIARALKADKLVLFSSIVAGFMGAHANAIISGTFVVNGALASVGAGEPIGAYVAALISCEIGLLVAGKTKLDIILIPLCTIITALLVVFFICPGVILAINFVSSLILMATELQPFLMGIIISVAVGILLTMPTSSAAICISLKLGGIAGGAAVVGCAAHMIGFAVQSFRENRFAGLIAQGIGTSMLQIPNVFKKPIIMLPPIIASAITGPMATCLFKITCDAAGSGMGTSGLVGVISTISASAGTMDTFMLVLAIVLLFFIIPAVVCLALSEIMRKKGIINYGDMALDL
ncbi:MAG: PTS sugar transporter subunit IIC [Clostridia bacterium]|nr:PTS sugar transporter subunit IIC [Clostridia bacterium]